MSVGNPDEGADGLKGLAFAFLLVVLIGLAILKWSDGT